LDDQIARLTVDKRPELHWAYLRKANLLVQRGRKDEAFALCREQAVRLGSPVLWEWLADAQLVSSNAAEAVKLYQKAMEQGNDPHRQLRLARKLAQAHEANQQPSLGLAVYEGLIRAHPHHGHLADFYRRARDLAEAANDTAKAAEMQTCLDQLLAAGKPK
jgi:tetratricopeptide (TPR) repeat protein